MNILLGVTGSVAAILTGKLVDSLSGGANDQIVVVSTEKAKQFHSWPAHVDADEWATTYKKGGSILHIDLAKWADVFVIAPCSANTLAKLANGLADNLLTCCARAWDFEKRIVIAPSMNVKMWEHPVTQEHLEKLKKWRVLIVEPQEKMLACGDFGVGAMAQIEDIVKQVDRIKIFHDIDQ